MKLTKKETINYTLELSQVEYNTLIVSLGSISPRECISQGDWDGVNVLDAEDHTDLYNDLKDDLK